MVLALSRGPLTVSCAVTFHPDLKWQLFENPDRKQEVSVDPGERPELLGDPERKLEVFEYPGGGTGSVVVDVDVEKGLESFVGFDLG